MSGKGKKESKLPPFLPPEAAKFAKQLGLDIHGLEPEAQHLWNHLEKLSTENPLEYERFIAEQMSAAKEDEIAGNEQKGGRAFRPAGKRNFFYCFRHKIIHLSSSYLLSSGICS